MMDETDIDDGERQTAARNEENEFIHSRLLRSLILNMGDIMALVSSLHGTIYNRKVVST